MTRARYIGQNYTPLGQRRGGAGWSVLAWCLTWLAGTAGADATRAPGSPIGPGTVPPSSYEKSSPVETPAGDRSSLMYLPGMTDSSGNLIMTGNVSGGKYFHGYLPYGSTTRLGAPLGSTQLDSFLRYTSVPQEWDGYPDDYSPFYSPTGTVASTPVGSRGAVLAPSGPRGTGGVPVDRPADVRAISEASSYPAGAGPTGSLPSGNYDISAGAPSGRMAAQSLGFGTGPESPIPNPQSAMIALSPPAAASGPRASAPPNNGLMTPEDYRRQLEQLQQDIERVKANALALEQSLQANDASPARAAGQQPLQTTEPISPLTPSSTVAPPQGQPSRPPGGASPLSDQAPVPGKLQSVSGPRVLDVRWLPQNGPADDISLDRPTQLRAPLYAAPARPEPSGSAPATPAGRLDAALASPGRPGAATGSIWTEVPALQVQPTAQAVSGVSSSPLPGLPRFSLPPAPAVKPSPEQVSALITRLRGASPGGNTAGGNDSVRALPDPSQQLIGDRTFSTYRSPLRTAAVPQGNESAGATPLRPQTPGMTDNPALLVPKGESDVSLPQERFERCVETAELYLRQGRYYRAAELFTFAATYQPNDARVHLGRSYALFAAGEYLSSALCLARAVELDPRTVLGRLDLVDAIGGPQVFAPRITDLEQCAGTGAAPQLQFLLAYVYRQMNRPAEAKAALAAAEKQLSPSPALDLLKAVISRQ